MSDAPISQQETLARAVESSQPLLTRYLAGFNDDNRTRQAPGLPNHAGWTLGHCALTMYRLAENHLHGHPLPDCDFITGDGTAGDAGRFDTESVCYGSTPVDRPEMYPTMERGRAVFDGACAALAAAVRAADDATLAAEMEWHGTSYPTWSLVLRVCFHNGTHAGQLTDLRRGLGMDNII
ncbi:MAG: hypothetical protein D8M59_02455 [Planctomycetes bacterium]|nr:hypothetical protein [Planctomycetota bacterium]NOG54419.1 hypothetical protein [Planctomycetota bacterium]